MKPKGIFRWVCALLMIYIPLEMVGMVNRGAVIVVGLLCAYWAIMSMLSNQPGNPPVRPDSHLPFKDE